MAEEDAYGNKAKYERFIENLEEFALEPQNRVKNDRRKQGKYYCRYKPNLYYFNKLAERFAFQDLSYIRRNRMFDTMRIITWFFDKDLKDVTREDIDNLVKYIHTIGRKATAKRDYLMHIRVIWRILFPVVRKTEEGMEEIQDDYPYVVRHIKLKVDRSKEVRDKDILEQGELSQILDYFVNEPAIRAFIAVVTGSAARPQEALYRQLRDVKVEPTEDSATIEVSSHGKEGNKLLLCTWTYPYLAEWLRVHPAKQNKNSWLFVNQSNKNTLKQIKAATINKKLRKACKVLGIDKRITIYSLKRTGISMMRLWGYSDREIQAIAGWTSTRQLQTYDYSSQRDAFEKIMARHNKGNGVKIIPPEAKICMFCNESNEFTAELCKKCKRLLDRSKIEDVLKERQQMPEQMKAVMQQLMDLQRQITEMQKA